MSEAEKELRAFYDMLLEHGWIAGYELKATEDPNIFDINFKLNTPIEFVKFTMPVDICESLKNEA